MNFLLPHPILELAHSTDSRPTIHAVTLFLDISGFTPLTEALMTQGKVGAEILADIVNDTFRPVITSIYAHGGYISGFAGDAFTAVFEKSTNHEAGQQTAKNALNTAVEIRSLFENKAVNTPTGTFPLAVKLGLASGVVEYGLIGDEAHRTYYYRGPAIDACAQAEHHCEKGDIVLTADLQAELNADCVAVNEHFFRLQTWRNAPSPSAIFPEFEIESATAFYPRSIIESAVGGEFRQLASVFVSFRNFSTDADLNTFMSDVLREVNSREGYFNRLDFGDKGGNCLIFFGAPSAHENDMARALQLALFLREKYGANVRVGVTVGQTYFGRVGIPERCEFTALGTEVNFAARLMMKADWGQILAPERVTQQIGFVFTSLGAFAYKGFTAPVDTFQLDHAKLAEDNLFTAPMAGRMDEIRALKAVSSAAFAGQAQAALIYGEPGMGKSRLAYALHESLGERAIWLEGQTDSILRQAFNPFIYILQNYFEQTADADHAGFEMRFQSLQSAVKSEELRAELIRTQSFLGALINLHWAGSLYAQLDDPKLRYGNTLAALRAFLLALAQIQPIVIQIEDGQWLDSASRETLTRLTRQTAKYPILLLITSRYNDDGSLPEFQIEEWRVTHLELRQLPSESLRVLVEQQMGSGLHDSLFTFLEERSQGVPFFAQQLALYLQETNTVTLSDGLWSLRSETNAIPDSLQAMLIARLDRLSQQVKDTVQTAAVLGREFDVRLLSQMLHMESTSNVGEAERGQIWSALTEWRYLFKHLLLREAAYEMQLRARLRDLHHAALAAYENFYAANLHPHYADLAYHAEYSGDEGKQREYFHLAGNSAQAAYANAAALDYYGRLLPLLMDASKQIEVHLKRGAVLELIGQWPEAEADYHTALNLATSEAAATARCQHALGVVAYKRVDFDSALVWLSQARAGWEAQHDRDGMSKTEIEMGNAFWRKGDYVDARKYLESGLVLARELDDQRSVAQALNALGRVLWNQGDLIRAGELFKESLSLWQKLGDKQGESASLNNLGIIASEQADYATARALWEASMALRQELGDKPGVSGSLNNLAALAIFQGEYEAARTLYEESLALRRGMGDKGGVGESLTNLAVTAFYQGDYAAARALHQESLALRREAGDKRNIAIVLYNLGEVAIEERDFTQAQAFHVESLALTHAIGDKRYTAYNLLGLAAVALALGQIQRTAQLAAAAKTLWDIIKGEMEPNASRQYERTCAEARSILGEAAFNAAWAEGENLTLDQSVSYALTD